MMRRLYVDDKPFGPKSDQENKLSFGKAITKPVAKEEDISVKENDNSAKFINSLA